MTSGRSTSTALVADMSLSGIKLLGDGFPPVGGWLSLAVMLSPQELAATGRVAWVDRARGACGIELHHECERHRHELGLAMLRLALEVEADHRAAVLLVDDPSVAASLCEPLRQHEFIPIAVRTRLDAAAVLTRDRPRVQLAIIASRALGTDGDTVAAFLADEFPRVVRIALGERIDRELDELSQVA